MLTRWQRPGILPAAIVAGLALGCGEVDDAGSEGAAPDSAVVRAEIDTTRPTEPKVEPAAGGAARAELEARGGTDVSGSAVLTPQPGATAVTVEIHAANSGYPYVAELIEGSCESPGSVIAALGEITAGERGDGEYREVMSRSLLPPDGANRAVWIRGADDPTAIVACGNLGASAGATSATGR